MSKINLQAETTNSGEEEEQREKTDMLRSIGKQSGESVESDLHFTKFCACYGDQWPRLSRAMGLFLAVLRCTLWITPYLHIWWHVDM